VKFLRHFAQPPDYSIPVRDSHLWRTGGLRKTSDMTVMNRLRYGLRKQEQYRQGYSRDVVNTMTFIAAFGLLLHVSVTRN
jgi:hypothetical protein